MLNLKAEEAVKVTAPFVFFNRKNNMDYNGTDEYVPKKEEHIMANEKIFICYDVKEGTIESRFHLLDSEGELEGFSVLVNNLQMGSRLITFINENGETFADVKFERRFTEPIKVTIFGREAYLSIMQDKDDDFYTVLVTDDMIVKNI